ncbi:uncharacterized protein LOC129729211 [Wyeomyia smithii]|uniref:uncharacterized protein LOC129729211 n=1 Tax=Wyeomyia smithii TaxID=174621 RepID=UPI0024681916|nr:uncharacterized protein LOC129729211 [Wyeomyia smithii]
MATKRIWTTDQHIESQLTAKINNAIHSSSADRPFTDSTGSGTGNGINTSRNPYLVGVQSRFRRRYYHKSIFIILIVVIVILLIGLIVVACLLHFPPAVCHSADCLRTAAALKQSMDTGVDPCEDFYRYTCGNWADDHPRPDSYTSYDWFSERQSRILRNIRQYLQLNDSTSDDPKPVKQARSMYRGCMNLTAMDALGYEPIFTLLSEFYLPDYPTMLNITDTNYEDYSFDWVRSLAKIRQLFGFDIMIGFDVFPDPTNRDFNKLVLGTPEKKSDLPFNENILQHITNAKHRIMVSEKDDDDDDDDAEENTNYMKAYKTFMIGTMKILVNNSDPKTDLDGFKDSFTKAADVYVKMSKVLLKLDKLAENSSKSNLAEDSLNLQDLVNTTARELQALTDQFLAPRDPLPIWEQYLDEVFDGVPEAQLNLNEDLILTSNADIYYLQLLTDYLSRTPLVHIELFIWWNVVEELILHTTTEIRKLHYEYYKVTAVTEGFTPRSLYCVGAVNKLMGMAVSYAIADKHFLRDTKPEMQRMLRYIQGAFERLVRDATWMDWKTKRSTLDKSKAMRSLIGFPEWLLNQTKLEEHYDKLEIDDAQHLDNMMQVIQLRNIKQLRRWRLKNVLSWDTVPTNVNAFHTFQDNAITVPIAILQYPFYHLTVLCTQSNVGAHPSHNATTNNARVSSELRTLANCLFFPPTFSSVVKVAYYAYSRALNYGAIGTILGHELTHGFDDSGRQFDQGGNLKQWWSNSTIREYVNRTACFVQQYSGYYIDEAKDYIDGRQTLGENIADNGGVREAYYAYKMYAQLEGKEPLLPGFENYTHEQLFFISYGNLWCESHTASAAKAALDDTHCPGWVRLKGVLSNSQEFSRTFGCRPGSGMNPTGDKCRICTSTNHLLKCQIYVTPSRDFDNQKRTGLQQCCSGGHGVVFGGQYGLKFDRNAALDHTNGLGRLKNENGQFTTDSQETLSVMMETHFPGSTQLTSGNAQDFYMAQPSSIHDKVKAQELASPPISSVWQDFPTDDVRTALSQVKSIHSIYHYNIIPIPFFCWVSFSSCRVFCRRFFICILLLAVVLLSSVIYAAIRYARSLPDVCHTKECLRSAAAFKQSMDLTVDPCEDFYSYVCGNWADDHPRPEARGEYDWFGERQIKIFRNIRAKLETNASKSDPKPVAQSKAMYKSCLNYATRKREGFKAVGKYLREFGLPAVPTLLSQSRTSARNFKFDWISSVAKIQRTLGLNVIIGFDIVPDHLDKNRNRLTLEYFYSPPDFQFPFYEWSKFKPNGHNRLARRIKQNSDEEEDEDENEESFNPEEVAEVLEQTVEAIHPGLNIMKWKNRFPTLAEQFIDFDKSLPERYEPEEEEEPDYFTVEQLQNLTDSYITPRKPYPVWQRYLDVLFADIPDAKPKLDEKLQIDNGTVQYLHKLVDSVSRQSLAHIELYVWSRVASFLVDHELNDIESEQECAENVHRFFGLAVSYAIADSDFLAETKPRIERMLREIGTEFDRMVLETDWMDAYTKYASLEKSKAMKNLVGFPDWIVDTKKLEEYYEGLEIDEGRYLENWINAIQFLQTDKLRSWQVKNNRVWDMDPTEVNAFYLADRNAIYIPIAIIQYPFYHLGLEALNYGALGEVLGHELTHGFDNSGRHYDKNGNMKRWWSNHTIQEYDDRADCFVDQYSSFYVKEAKQYVNGSLTLGENIADNGGLREAFWAYKAFQKMHGPEPNLPGFDGFTHEQLLFISYGNQNCQIISPRAAKGFLEDEHSPSRFRVRGVLSNMQEFSDAFNCPAGSAMNPQKKCRIW